MAACSNTTVVPNDALQYSKLMWEVESAFLYNINTRTKDNLEMASQSLWLVYITYFEVRFELLILGRISVPGATGKLTWPEKKKHEKSIGNK